MWWNHAGYGPMYGMWFMPIFGLLCMLIFVYFLSRIIGGKGGDCRPLTRNPSRHNPVQGELLDEIRALRREVQELREKQKEVQ